VRTRVSDGGHSLEHGRQGRPERRRPGAWRKEDDALVICLLEVFVFSVCSRLRVTLSLGLSPCIDSSSSKRLDGRGGGEALS
jgi:hypothetical protein